MLIRKSFEIESAHIVRDCTSERCSFSLHGHSALVELFFTSQGLDNGQMILDFGLMKGTIKDFVDSFDHCHVIWSKESEEDKQFFKKYSSRWIELPCSPSAEMLSLAMYYVIDQIMDNTKFNNGEHFPTLHSVRYHETRTGWAESFGEDLRIWPWDLSDILISDAIKKEWKDPEMWDKLRKQIPFINPTVQLKFK